MLHSYQGLVFRAIPFWRVKEKGLTLEEICRITEIDKRFSYVILNWIDDFVKEGKVEIINCGNDPIRYRQCKTKY